LVLPTVGAGKVAKRVAVGCGVPACSVAARAVTVKAAAVYALGVTGWPDGRLHPVMLRIIRKMAVIVMVSLLAFTYWISLWFYIA
jgi:hypothetical protein